MLSSKRTTVALGIVAVALVGFIWVFELGSVTTSELEARRGRLLPGFVRDRVTAVMVEHDGEQTVFAKDAAHDRPSEWRMTEPVRGRVDADAVDALLGALEWAEPRRTIVAPSSEDLTRFGLDEPSVRITVTVADLALELALGGRDPQGTGRYARVDGAGPVRIVESDLYEALTHEPDHFRSRDPFPELAVHRATKVVLSGPAVPERTLSYRDGRWWIDGATLALADRRLVESMLRGLDDMRVVRFVQQASIDSPREEIVVEREVEGRETQRARLRVGRACEGASDGRLVRVDEGPVICVAGQAVAALSSTRQALRERRLLWATEEEVARVALTAGGRSVVLARRQDGWSVSLGPSSQTTTDAEDPPPLADDSAVSTLLRALHGTMAEAFLSTAPPRAFVQPLARIEVDLLSEEPPEVLLFGVTRGASLLVRRGDEVLTVADTSELRAHLGAASLRFRSLRVAAQRGLDARRVELTRAAPAAPAHEVVVKEQGAWTVPGAEAAAVDGLAVDALSRELGTLTALRFAAEDAEPEHGLAAPALTLQVDYSPGTDHAQDEPAREPRSLRLQVGADTDGGAYARMGDDPAVFVIPRAFVERLRAPLAAPESPATVE